MKNKTAYLFLFIALLLAASAVVLLILKPGNENTNIQATTETETEQTLEIDQPEPIENLNRPNDLGEPKVDFTDSELGLSTTQPEELISRIAAALEKGDMEAVSKIVGKDAFDSDDFAQLSKLVEAKNFQLSGKDALREVGEIKLNQRSRWALELDLNDTGEKRIYFDLERDGNKWRVDKVILPSTDVNSSFQAVQNDPLGIADAFLQAILQQDFETARQYVDKVVVSEAKIAGLCILFEEGEYKLRSSKPLRAMFTREDRVGYLANVMTQDGSKSAQFSLNLSKAPSDGQWRVYEVNLDQLLADYANRVAGGDTYYSPLVKNPSGGETLALYFEFDEDSMSPRTRRQLEIVASMLKTDPAKKITLSGHTDALGTKSYNNELSANRADVVAEFLNEAGVSAEQIITIAKGASQPRRPNLTESGEDNPQGRRANRRTEIYLDF